MAQNYILANKDGTSNAKAGDIVVTGGGLYKKNTDGTSTKVGALPTSTGTTKDYNVVQNVYREITSMFGGKNGGGNKGNGGGSSYSPGTSGIGSGDMSSGRQQERAKISKIDSNGIADVEISGYDPADYGGYYYGSSISSSGSGGGFSNVVGWVVLGLCGIALLDRFMNKPKKG